VGGNAVEIVEKEFFAGFFTAFGEAVSTKPTKKGGESVNR
jgi:hypothetical protein